MYFTIIPILIHYIYYIWRSCIAYVKSFCGLSIRVELEAHMLKLIVQSKYWESCNQVPSQRSIHKTVWVHALGSFNFWSNHFRETLCQLVGFWSSFVAMRLCCADILSAPQPTATLPSLYLFAARYAVLCSFSRRRSLAILPMEQ